MLNSLSKWEKFNIFLVVIFAAGACSLLLYSQPAVTGHVSAVYLMKDVKVVAVNDMIYNLKSSDGQQLLLKSVMVSGKVVGDGDAKIYLENNGTKYLIYSNKAEGADNMMAITGYIIKETSEQEPKEGNLDFSLLEQHVLPEFNDTETDDSSYSEEFKAFVELLKNETQQDKAVIFSDFVKNADGTEFKNECIETCALFGLSSNSYKFEFDVEPGTILSVDQIVYSVETEEIPRK